MRYIPNNKLLIMKIIPILILLIIQVYTSNVYHNKTIDHKLYMTKECAGSCDVDVYSPNSILVECTLVVSYPNNSQITHNCNGIQECHFDVYDVDPHCENAVYTITLYTFSEESDVQITFVEPNRCTSGGIFFWILAIVAISTLITLCTLMIHSEYKFRWAKSRYTNSKKDDELTESLKTVSC